MPYLASFTSLLLTSAQLTLYPHVISSSPTPLALASPSLASPCFITSPLFQRQFHSRLKNQGHMGVTFHKSLTLVCLFCFVLFTLLHLALLRFALPRLMSLHLISPPLIHFARPRLVSLCLSSLHRSFPWLSLVSACFITSPCFTFPHLALLYLPPSRLASPSVITSPPYPLQHQHHSRLNTSGIWEALFHEQHHRRSTLMSISPAKHP